MTSEPDSTARRRPPTIDLTATEVAADKPAAGNDPAAEGAQTDGASGQPSTKPAAGGPGGPRLFIVTAFASIAAGALVVAIIGVGLWFAGYVPAREPAAVPNAQPPNSAAIAEISARLNKIEGAIATQQQQKPVPPPQPDPALLSRLAAAEAATKSLSDSLAALTHRVDDAAAAAQNALAQAKSASTAADAAKSAAQTEVMRAAISMRWRPASRRSKAP